MKNGHFGKDHPERFIEGALDGESHGGSGPHGFQDSMTSNEMEKFPAEDGQHILTPYALDNVGKVYDRYETSMKDMKMNGGPENLSHSLTGVHAVQEGPGTKHGHKSPLR